MLPRLVLFIALIATAALYWPGLSGPFIFDDAWNLEPLRLWLKGGASFQEVLLPQASIVFSRPVAMASFMLTTWLFGADSFSFKLGNLITHLICGVLGWMLLRRALARDTALAPHAELLAALATAIWLLHPLHVSTVLYAIQRMAQLSTLFTLAAVLTYFLARRQLIEGRVKAAWFNLFVTFPVMMVLGLLSKQNAAVAPALCLVMELAYFTDRKEYRRSVISFFGIFLALPMLGLAAFLTAAPKKLLATYEVWDFTLWERLLTQPRALMDYISMLVLPRGPSMGLYTDDFAVSHGLLSPPATLLSLLALIAISLAAFVLRKRAPSLFAGWYFFLVAHGVESSFLPLEMYYEHRNYLPSLGLILAIVSVPVLISSRIRTNNLSKKQLGIFAVGGFILMFGAATLGRVLIWQDVDAITQQALVHHPESLRLRFDLSVKALERGDFDNALRPMEHLAESDDPRHRQLGNLSIFTIKCLRKDPEIGLENLKKAVDEDLPRLTTYEAQSFMRLSRTSRVAGCGNVGVDVIADYLSKIVNSASAQPESAQTKWYSRAILAEMYAHTGAWPRAKQQAELSWESSNHDPKVGALLVSIYIKIGNLSDAKNILTELGKTIKPYDKGGQIVLNSLHKQILDTPIP